MSTEDWLPVVGWEGFYEVSDLGRIKSLPRTIPRSSGRPLNLRGRILKQALTKDGYHVVALCRNDRKTECRVQRLVLTAFVGPCPEGMESCHENGDKDNNTLSNLRWDTRSVNTFDKVRHGAHPFASKTECPRGHSYDEVNTYVARGRRHCITCRNERKRERRAAAKLERNAV